MSEVLLGGVLVSDQDSVLDSDEERRRFVARPEKADVPLHPSCRLIDVRDGEKPPECRSTNSPTIGSRLVRRYLAVTPTFTLATDVSSFP